MGSLGYLHTDHTDPTTDYVLKKSAQDTRSDRRHAFVASVKVVHAKSGKQILSATSNVSRSGCHVRTSTPFQPGTRVKVTINHQGTTFKRDGEVVYAIPGAGMGLHFENSQTAEEDAIKERLVQLGDEAIERVRERVSSRKQKIVLILGIVVLAATVAGLSILLGLLR
jgi:PilZ domain-containing protein